MKLKTKVLAGIAAVASITIAWSLGVATDIFANPAFASFWWISREVAAQAQYVGAFSGAITLCGIGVYALGKPKK